MNSAVWNDFLNIKNVKILPYKVPKHQNNSFFGLFRLLYGYNLLPYTSAPWIYSCGHFEGSNKFLWPSVHEIWFLRLFCPARAISWIFPANRPWPKIWHLLFLTLLEQFNSFWRENQNKGKFFDRTSIYYFAKVSNPLDLWLFLMF